MPHHHHFSSKDFLFFLFPVLFSSDDNIIESTSSGSRENDDGNNLFDFEEIEAFRMSYFSEEGKFRNSSVNQNLNSKWTLWYEQKSDKKKPKCLNKSDYLKELKKAGTFHNISTFWNSWKEVQDICRMTVEGGVNYHLFKDTIKPVWEDPKNIKGGKWSFILPSSTSNRDIMRNWISLMIATLIGELGNDAEINGAVLSVRSWGCMFSVWNRNANDKQLVENVSEKLKEIFDVPSIKYQRHQVRVKRNNAERAKIAKSKRVDSSDDSISSTETSSSEGEQDKSFRSTVREVSRSRSTSTELNEQDLNLVSQQQTPEVKESQFIPESSKIEQKGQQAIEDENRQRVNPNVVASQESHHYEEKFKSHQLKSKKEEFPLNSLGVVIILAAGVVTSAISWAFYL